MQNFTEYTWYKNIQNILYSSIVFNINFIIQSILKNFIKIKIIRWLIELNIYERFMNHYNWISKLNKYYTIPRDHGDLFFCQYGIQRALCRDEEAKNEVCEESRRNKRLSPSGCLLERSNRYQQLDLPV